MTDDEWVGTDSRIAYCFKTRDDAMRFVNAIDLNDVLKERGGLQVDLLYDPDDPDYYVGGRRWNVELILRDNDDRYGSVLEDEILTPVAERFGGVWSGS